MIVLYFININNNYKFIIIDLIPTFYRNNFLKKSLLNIISLSCLELANYRLYQ